MRICKLENLQHILMARKKDPSGHHCGECGGINTKADYYGWFIWYNDIGEEHIPLCDVCWTKKWQEFDEDEEEGYYGDPPLGEADGLIEELNEF